MTHSNESLLKYTAIYRCSDDVINLKIRIRLREVENLHDDSNNWEQKDFSWQQKTFSKSEREFYADAKNCITDLEKKYHLDVTKLPQNGAKFDLYCYTNDDEFTLKEPKIYRMATQDDEYDYKKSLLTAMQNSPNNYDETDAMFIMADLGEYVDTTWIRNEQVLCSVKFDKKSKILTIFPDFSNFEPYSIKIEGNTARKFKYFVENVSEMMPEDDRLKERELMRKLYVHKLAVRKQQTETNFTLPRKNRLQVSLFFEILWAKQFEYDTIYVQYFIDLPRDWSCDNNGSLQGVTQTCHTKNEEGLAHFGHVFDVVLEYNIEELGSGIPKCPYIYFEVISKDTWSRYRTEGLTYKNLPVAKPGSYRYELQCFRLIPDSISGQLRRFFIGDCSNYTDISWIGIPKDHMSKPPFCVLNKYGTNTVGTGQIAVRVNVMHQSQAFLDCYRESSVEREEIFEKLSSSTLVKSVEQVLQAFKKARKNMLAARKNL